VADRGRRAHAPGRRLRDLLGLHNQTVVTDAHRGDRLNKFAGVYRRYEVPTADNFSPDCRWVTVEPREPLLVLDRIFGEVRVPEVMLGSNVVHLPTVKTHVYTTMTGAMKNAFGGSCGRTVTGPTPTSTRPSWTSSRCRSRSTTGSSR